MGGEAVHRPLVEALDGPLHLLGQVGEVHLVHALAVNLLVVEDGAVDLPAAQDVAHQQQQGLHALLVGLGSGLHPVPGLGELLVGRDGPVLLRDPVEDALLQHHEEGEVGGVPQVQLARHVGEGLGLAVRREEAVGHQGVDDRAEVLPHLGGGPLQDRLAIGPGVLPRHGDLDQRSEPERGHLVLDAALHLVLAPGVDVQVDQPMHQCWGEGPVPLEALDLRRHQAVDLALRHAEEDHVSQRVEATAPCAAGHLPELQWVQLQMITCEHYRSAGHVDPKGHGLSADDGLHMLGTKQNLHRLPVTVGQTEVMDT
mmetsp:Transcript_54091/g.96248  ORF Transcript_54091/g.96248 Transcript_54091/m.96248 type:complete len:313 (-) Transcript_54091:2424-3362(-)